MINLDNNNLQSIKKESDTLTIKGSILFETWSKTASCLPFRIIYPKDEEEVQFIINLANQSGRKIRVVGSGLSPNDLCCTLDYMVSLKKMNNVISVDVEKKQITVQAGIQLKKIHPELSRNGLALSNLGSISEQTIGGILGTSVHGTGIQHPLLNSQIIRIVFYSGEGKRYEINQEEELYYSMLCNLGCLGIVTEVTIQCVDKFNLNIQQYPMNLNVILCNLNELINKNEFFRFWWFPHVSQHENDLNSIVWCANKTNQKAKRVTKLSFFEKLVKIHLYEALLYIGYYLPNIIPLINQFYFQRYFLPRIETIRTSVEGFNFDCLFKQNVSEWAIPIEYTQNAILDLKAWLERTDHQFKAHFPVEIRFVEQDETYLSPAYKRRVCFIGILMYKPYNVNVQYLPYFNEFEKIMLKYSGRPHWAKSQSLKKEQLIELYPKFKEFLRHRKQLDPNLIFDNEFCRRHLN